MVTGCSSSSLIVRAKSRGVKFSSFLVNISIFFLSTLKRILIPVREIWLKTPTDCIINIYTEREGEGDGLAF